MTDHGTGPAVAGGRSDSFDLGTYLSRSVERIAKEIFRASLSDPATSLFMSRYIRYAKKASALRLEAERSGRHVPPFLIASISEQCNLHCAGCYARAVDQCSDAAGECHGSCGQSGGLSQIPDDGHVKVMAETYETDGVECSDDTPVISDAAFETGSNNSYGVRHAAVTELSAARWDSIFSEAEQLGIAFIFLAGGEPMFRPDILEAAGRHRKMIFPVITNGTMFTESIMELLQRSPNLMPVISIEGGRAATDLRRGDGMYDRIMAAMERLKKQNRIFGVSITVQKGNMNEVMSDAFLDDLRNRGCRAVFFIEYVPVSPETAHLAPDDRGREYMSGRLAELRGNKGHTADILHEPKGSTAQSIEMIYIAFPGDEKHFGGCLAAGRGFFHISHDGEVQPCPFSPYSDTDLREASLAEALDSPLFRKLEESGLLGEGHEGGCALYGRDREVKEMAGK